MFKESKILEDFKKSKPSLFIVGCGGIGFNIAKIFLQDGYPLDKLYFMDGDKTDDKTLYKYGYSPNVISDVPKVNLLLEMARRKHRIDGADPLDFAPYMSHFMPFMFEGDMKELVPLLFSSSSNKIVIINCVDNSHATELLYDNYEKYSSNLNMEYFDIGFDGNEISVSQVPSWGDVSGYQIGSSNYLSIRAAMQAIEYIGAVLYHGEKRSLLSMDINNYAQVIEQMHNYDNYSEANFKMVNILKQYLEKAIEYYLSQSDLDVQHIGKFVYPIKKDSYVKNVLKKLPNGLFVKSLSVGIDSSREDVRTMCDGLAGLETWRVKNKKMDITIPLIYDYSMVSLFPPVKIDNIDIEYLKYIYAFAIHLGLDIEDPYLYSYLDYIANVEFNHTKISEHAGCYGGIFDNMSELILVLGFIKLTNEISYKQLLQYFIDLGFLYPQYKDCIFEYPLRINKATSYNKTHRVRYGISAEIFTSTTTERNKGFIVHCLTLDQEKDMKIMDGLTGEQIVLRYNGRREKVYIPNPEAVRANISFYKKNLFSGTDLSQLLSLEKMSTLVRFAISLQY